MCGIFAIFSSSLEPTELRKELIKCSSKLRHRGPDWSGYLVVEKDGERPLNHGIAHERLAIMDPESGEQPLVSPDGNVIVAANGEIYNYKEIYAGLSAPYTPKTGSDCEVMLPLWSEMDGIPTPNLPNQLRGMFSVIMYDKTTDTYFIFRDHIGKTPLYIGWGNDGSVYVGSEMKSMVHECNKFQNFPPGHCYSNKGPNAGQFVRWYKPNWAPEMKPGLPPPTEKYQADLLRHAFEKAVVRRMMSDVPWGVLLSGGLDSSLVASICARNVARRSSSFPKLHSFTVGLEGSPDLKAAKEVADFLGTIHHAYTYTLEEGADAIREVIRSVETYDLTTIRASTPMYLMSRKIKAMGIKMVLSGEGADEVFGGYLYFHKAPNAQEFYDETVDKISRLHMYDCLRANKSMSAWGVEPRCPFLDDDFLQVAMNLDPKEKMIVKGPGVSKEDTRIEKWAIRKAFDTPDDPYLPDNILWRQKEQFSDGVGYGWVDSLKDIAEREVSDQMFANAANRYPHNTPTTKEGYRYRMIFEEIFPGEAAERTVPGGKSIACSTERAMNWDASFALRADPSGRCAGVHDSAYDDNFVADTVIESDEPSSKKAKTN
ncbi:asparagine synthetase [Skeletonema marinoi]|uniref:asparagine synthase (glutamine-hydrolyzing) n=1 Tax=Skeletonema marinoi TaxID=267567 RepID=A0AAD8YFR7_9STRA|nr:asparagine synthetase [Skeletonema marinoi]|mmetsp:Transcript_28198/g.47929  ORF Transcript_28198/g.47929 Transcript_28198/m.47929 type:complete len:600 (-) Transcript_28198:1634-3433(-)